MKAKIAIKSDSITPFGGIFYVMDEIITFYNARGASEKKFDVMNNDFGWSHLPCSFMSENTTFLLLTAMAANFYLFLIKKISKVFKELKPESRIKRFLFRFIAVPAKWIKTGRRWVLNNEKEKWGDCC